MNAFLYHGIDLKDKTSIEVHPNFAFHLKIGEYEMEIKGSREEVFRTIEELPNWIVKINKAFEGLKPKTVATLTVKTKRGKKELTAQAYPKIVQTENRDETILKILETDWGKWRPRTIVELKEALTANGLNVSGRNLTQVLNRYIKKKRVRRWKTDAGYVYILAEKDA